MCVVCVCVSACVCVYVQTRFAIDLPVYHGDHMLVKAHQLELTTTVQHDTLATVSLLAKSDARKRRCHLYLSDTGITNITLYWLITNWD